MVLMDSPSSLTRGAGAPLSQARTATDMLPIEEQHVIEPSYTCSNGRRRVIDYIDTSLALF